MNRGSERVSSGLVFLGMKDIDIVEVGNRISSTFESLRQQVNGIRILSENSSQISTSFHQVRLVLHQDCRIKSLGKLPATFLSLRIVQRGITPGDDTVSSHTVLANLLRSLHKMLCADFVKWTGPQAYFNGAEFMTLTAPLDQPGKLLRSAPAGLLAHAPPRLSRLAVLSTQPIEDSSQRLDLEMQKAVTWAEAPTDQEAVRNSLRGHHHTETTARPVAQDIREETPLLRLSAWLISLGVGFVCLPVGCMLVIINLFRGENLRLASQTAALTGTFISLQASGSMAQAATTLKYLIP